MAETEGRELGWEDTISKDSSEFEPIPEGDYDFTDVYKRQVLAMSRIRSIPMISPIASTGRPTELNTIVRVTRPTLGTPAVPMEASVAVPTTTT